MITKKLVLTIQQEKKSVSGILNDNVIHQVCRITGLSEEELMDTLDRLKSLGIVDFQEATFH